LQDFDVRLPSLEDFSVADAQAKHFLQLTNLCLIIGKIEALSSRRREIHTEELSPIFTSLQNWIDELPDELRLYNKDTQRNPYSRPVSEIHIVYFVSVILLHLLQGQRHRPSPFFTASIVASSCIARLYEEILYREDVAYLLPINNWFSMVAAVPQLYCITRSPNKEEICVEELNIISSVLLQMREKYPAAGLVLANIDKLRRDRNNPPNLISPITDSNSGFGVEESRQSTIQRFTNICDLFPFPNSICPNMGLLSPATDVTEDMTASIFTPFSVENMDWIFNEVHPLIDIFSTQLNTLGLPVSFSTIHNHSYC